MDWEENKMKNLQSFLKRCDYNYFVLNNSLISDEEYDMLKNELSQLDCKYPHLKEKDLSFMGFKHTNTINHNTPMLSLKKTYVNKDIIKLFNKYGILISEPKFDGISLSLIYNSGLLIKALTRGNGFEGEDVSNYIFCINSIPKIINFQDPIEIRGELCIEKNIYKQYFSHKKSPRNIVGGLLKSLHTNIYLNKLTFIAYNALKINNNNHSDLLEFLKTLKFIIPQYTLLTNECQINNFIEGQKISINYLPYYCDGLVFKIQDLKLSNSLGNNDKYPLGNIGFKFQNLTQMSSLQNITWQVGRSGVLTPIALIKPIIIDNIEIKKCTFHNYSFINNIFINDILIVARSGSVIPNITKVIKGDGLQKINLPINCVICQSILLKSNKKLLCPNTMCDGQLLNRIKYFLQINKIKGLGNQLLKLLINTHIKYFVDIFFLHNIDIFTIINSKKINNNTSLSPIVWQKFLNNITQIPITIDLLNGITINGIGIKKKKKLIGDLMKYEWNDINWWNNQNWTDVELNYIKTGLNKHENDIKSLINFIKTTNN